VKQDFPLGIQFYFPGTALDNLKESYYPPENDTISAIRATEVAEGEKASRIFIALKRDVAYELIPEGADIKIAFRRADAAAAAGPPAAITETDVAAAAAPAPAVVPAKPWSAATEITGVNATPSPDGVLIDVTANGALQDYKTFTLAENPPRIVFDLPAVRSAAKSEQRIGVKGGPVDQVRYLGYPDKVRLVIQTQKPYLTQYSAEPTATGLLIRVGAAPATAAGRELKLATGAAPAPAPAKPEPVASGAAALVNRVEFAGEDAGKSTVIIGTTRPVQYDLVKTGDRRVSLKLMNTHVPEQHLRPLITSRFDSAVDRVSPSQEKQAAVVAIDLRGRGLSDHDPDWRKYEPRIEVADVMDQLAALGVAHAVFVGTSRGGLIAMGLAAARPGLLKGVVLNDIGPVIEAQGLIRIRSYVGKLPAPRGMDEAVDILRRISDARFPALSDDDWLAMARGSWTEKNGALVPSYDTSLFRGLAALDLEAPLPPIWPYFRALAGVPVLANVDAIFRPTSPDFPIPMRTTLPLQ